MSIAFVFPGQGSQHVGMGKEFFDNFSVSKRVFEEVDDALKQKLSHLIFKGEQETLTLTENAQPALMAVSLAILKALQEEFGKPLRSIVFYLAGHSLGEYTACAASSIFSITDTAKLLRIRGQAMQKAVPVGKGAMAALIGLSLEKAEDIAERASQGRICVIANDNSPEQIVLSGHKEAIERAIDIALEEKVKRAVLLPVSAPFHSPLIEEAAKAMEDVFAYVSLKPFEIPIIANITAHPVLDYQQIPSLLIKQVTSRVRWRESILKMEELGVQKIVEVGAGKVLTGLVKRIAPSIKTMTINTPHDIEAFLKSL
ncbi:MAG: ACP S-malonyltransferase [Proteobacteria bacterium]|nr:ACP S-malonyltransferase [Pseudomonadota bacterium]